MSWKRRLGRERRCLKSEWPLEPSPRPSTPSAKISIFAPFGALDDRLVVAVWIAPVIDGRGEDATPNEWNDFGTRDSRRKENVLEATPWKSRNHSIHSA
jgi:hypothetical protein